MIVSWHFLFTYGSVQTSSNRFHDMEMAWPGVEWMEVYHQKERASWQHR